MSGYKSADFVGHYAERLRNADPASYDAFLEAFAAYATEITVAVTDAPQDQILHMQGRAKQTLLVLALLKHPKPIQTPPSAASQ